MKNVCKVVSILIVIATIVCSVTPVGARLYAPDGMSDEEKLGFTYNMLDEYISDSNADIPADTRELIEKKHVANLHKLQLMPA